mgnify:CR=1 FL=1
MGRAIAIVSALPIAASSKITSKCRYLRPHRFQKTTTSNYNAIIRQAQKAHTVLADSISPPLPWIARRKVVS